jgi:hypothetical protein
MERRGLETLMAADGRCDLLGSPPARLHLQVAGHPLGWCGSTAIICGAVLHLVARVP